MLSALSNYQRTSPGARYGDDAPSDGPMIKGINSLNDALNGRFLSSFGQVLNLVPIAGPIAHVIPDIGGHLLSKTGEGFAHMLGEKGSVHTHLEHEWLGLDKQSGTGDGGKCGLHGHHHRTTTRTYDASNGDATRPTACSMRQQSSSSTDTRAGYGMDRFDDSVADRRIIATLAIVNRPNDFRRLADVSDVVSDRRFSVDIRS